MIKCNEDRHHGPGCMDTDILYGMNDEIECKLMGLNAMIVNETKGNDRNYQMISYLSTCLWSGQKLFEIKKKQTKKDKDKTGHEIENDTILIW